MTNSLGNVVNSIFLQNSLLNKNKNSTPVTKSPEQNQVEPIEKTIVKMQQECDKLHGLMKESKSIVQLGNCIDTLFKTYGLVKANVIIMNALKNMYTDTDFSDIKQVTKFQENNVAILVKKNTWLEKKMAGNYIRKAA